MVTKDGSKGGTRNGGGDGLVLARLNLTESPIWLSWLFESNLVKIEHQ